MGEKGYEFGDRCAPRSERSTTTTSRTSPRRPRTWSWTRRPTSKRSIVVRPQHGDAFFFPSKCNTWARERKNELFSASLHREKSFFCQEQEVQGATKYPVSMHQWTSLKGLGSLEVVRFNMTPRDRTPRVRVGLKLAPFIISRPHPVRVKNPKMMRNEAAVLDKDEKCVNGSLFSLPRHDSVREIKSSMFRTNATGAFTDLSYF